MTRQAWNKRNNNVSLGNTKDFVYQETFRCHSGQPEARYKLRVWTIVNGHLVSNCEEMVVSLDNRNQLGSSESIQSSGDCVTSDRETGNQEAEQLSIGKQKRSRWTRISQSETHLNHCHQQFARNSKVRKSFPVGQWNQAFTPEEGDDCLVI